MTWSGLLEKRLSLCLVALLTLPGGANAVTYLDVQVPQSSSSLRQNDQADKSLDGQQDLTTPPSGEMGSAPPADQTASAVLTAPSPQGPQPPNPAPTSLTPTPLGTAAAPETRRGGVPGSTPAGAAIAPGKQKRVLRLSVRTALVVGAVIAVGVVAGASLASPGHP